MYLETFGILVAICGVLSFFLQATPVQTMSVSKGADFKSFQRIYLSVYLLLMTGDWLQGPYVYALYQKYSFDMNDIAILFVAGFLSSAIFGTVIGSFADTIGRKKSALLFCVVYSLSCLTKLSPNFNVLFLGRILAGIATSLLFSVPEAWMVCEHNKKAFDENLISETFAWATWGNGLVAILSGMLANWAADFFGIVAPFMVAIAMFILAMLIISPFWNENYGQTKSDNWLTSLKSGFFVAKGDVKILSIGLIQSLFEGAMYSWVFIWTPALQRGLSHKEELALPFGWIFASFMVAVMIGSILFGYLSKKFSVEALAKPVYLLGSFCLLVPAVISDTFSCFLAFLAFELICGMHWPLTGTLRSKYIPEDSRSAVMNLMRVPLNLIVVVVLLKVQAMDISTVFGICFLLIFTCFLFSFSLPSSDRPTVKAESASMH